MRYWLHRPELVDDLAPDDRRARAIAPGRRTLTMNLAPHAKRAAATIAAPEPPLAAVQRIARDLELGALMDVAVRPDLVHDAASRGISGPSAALPYVDQIQRAFGHHDVRGIRAHTDEHAARGAEALGAEAFATGRDVGFATAALSLHTAAHEAAHVVQQRGGVKLKSGVGEAGDLYEQHADAVADRVVRGESAEALLDQHVDASRAADGGDGGVQLKPSTYRGRLTADPLMTPSALEQLKRPAWIAYVRQVMQYFDLDDDAIEQQQQLLPYCVSQAQRLAAMGWPHFTKAQQALVTQISEMFELRRVGRLFFVDQERAVRRQAAHQQHLPQSQQVHLGHVRLADDRVDDHQKAVVHRELLIGRRNKDVLVCPFRQFQLHRVARAAE